MEDPLIDQYEAGEDYDDCDGDQLRELYDGLPIDDEDAEDDELELLIEALEEDQWESQAIDEDYDE